jgi:Mrp family chromosome partitioning ATPase
MLGRMVDSSLLVVRAGSHQLVTLKRAKAMLEQSHISIAGVIVNGLHDDIHNWSSYGYDQPLSRTPDVVSRNAHSLGALRSADSDHEELVLAGSIDNHDIA